MAPITTDNRTRDLLSLVAAIAYGPVFYLIGAAIPGLIYAAAAGYFVLGCAIIVPLLILLAYRWRMVIWQVAIASSTLTVLGDNLRINAIHINDVGQITRVSFVFWASATVLSSPVPIYFVLRSIKPPQRYLVGFSIVVTVIGLWFAIKRITG